MKVINETNNKVPFSEIELGECFVDKGNLYIRTLGIIAESGYRFNCIDAKTGDLEWFVDNFKVCPVEGEIHFRSKT